MHNFQAHGSSMVLMVTDLPCYLADHESYLSCYTCTL